MYISFLLRDSLNEMVAGFSKLDYLIAVTDLALVRITRWIGIEVSYLNAEWSTLICLQEIFLCS